MESLRPQAECCTCRWPATICKALADGFLHFFLLCLSCVCHCSRILVVIVPAVTSICSSLELFILRIIMCLLTAPNSLSGPSDCWRLVILPCL